MRPDPHYFFALWPDPGWARALSERVRSSCDEFGVEPVNRTALTDLHLTLAFMGALSALEGERAVSIARGLEWKNFTLRLDCLGTFPHSKILWVAPSFVAPELTALVRLLRRRLEKAGVPIRGPGDFAPHLSLARLPKPLSGGILAIEPMDWRVTCLCLARSRPGPPYEIIERRFSSGGEASQPDSC